MTIQLDCEKARRMFPDILEDQAQVAAAHAIRCPACAAELREFRAIVEAAGEPGPWGVPDPGEAYWDGFLPALRTRISGITADRPDAPAPWWRKAAAAAVLLLAAGLAPLRGPAPSPDLASLEQAADRLEAGFERLAAASGGDDRLTPALVGPGGISLELIREPGPGDVLDALSEILLPPAPGGLWDDERLIGWLETLDENELTALIQDLGKERS